MAPRSSAQLRVRLGVAMLGFVCALLISAGAIARNGARCEAARGCPHQASCPPCGR